MADSKNKIVCVDFDGAAQSSPSCAVCRAPLKPKRTKYCSRACYFSVPVSAETRARQSAAAKGKPKSTETRARISAANTGKPRPWQIGANNPNYGNKAQGAPAARTRFLAAVEGRGSPWNESHRRAHSIRMLGPSNKMRGRSHSSASLAAMSASKRKQYADGTVKVAKYNLSKNERAIGEALRRMVIPVMTQFHIHGVPFRYDFVFPHSNLLLEFNGDWWHANPERYPAGTVLSFHGKSVPVESIWARDAAKRAAAIDAGFRFASVWESEFKARGMEAVTCLL